MFTIYEEAKQYYTYTLADKDANSEIEVVPERGGIITRWRQNGKEILYLDEARYQDPSKTVRGGVPILFPICGNLPNDTFEHRGNAYKLIQHGFGRHLSWKVIEQDVSNCASITLAIASTPETLAVYPFEFEVSYTYQLKGNSLKILQTYTNKSDQEMPFSAGFHPYFQVGDKQKLSVDIPGTKYDDNVSKKTFDFSGEFDYSSAEIDAAFTSISGKTTSFSDRDLKRKITINYSDFFSTLVFWTLNGQDFVCLEPWSTPRNGLNTGKQLNILAPGANYNAEIELICESI